MKGIIYHCPIVMHIALNVQHDQSQSRKFTRKVTWKKANADHVLSYKYALSTLLKDIELPYQAINCIDLQCKLHLGEIDRYYNSIISKCIIAANRCIPKSGKPRLAGWNEHVKSYKEQSIMWHRIWVDNGCPRHGVIYDIKRRTQANHKRAVRYVNKNQSNLKAEKLATALKCQNKRNFWDEMRRISGKRCNMPNVDDDAQCDDKISRLFADNYNNLYNSVSYDVNDMQDLINELECSIENDCGNNACTCTSSHVITCDDVTDAVLRLKPHKADGVEDASSDILINGCNELFVHLSLLFNIMLRHGQCPRNMLLTTLVPIPKNRKKSLNDSSNYRAIALGSVVGKVMDNIILEKHQYVLKSNDLQYGFKAKHSSTHCTFVLNEVVDYYVNNGSSVYLVLLDASRAFDRVQYVKLFKLLIKRGLCSLTARFLAFLYTNQRLRVKWNGHYSDSFVTSNGVKQGGIISPILFCIYIDELLVQLRNAHVGCHIGNTFLGGLGYADDLCLLAPSRGAITVMLNICEQFGIEYDVLFNSQKSHLIIYNTNFNYQDIPPLKLNGEKLESKEVANHLGHPIGNTDTNNSAIGNAVKDIVWRTNFVMSKFGFCHCNVRSFMFRTYCTSYYGSPLWRLNSSAINRFYVTWRKCIRKVWGVSPRTHCRLLQHLYGSEGIECELLSRFLSFYHSICTSDNYCTRLCSLLCQSSRTAVANNRRIVCATLNVDGDCLHAYKKSALMKCFECQNECRMYGHMLKELCLIRDGGLSVELCQSEILCLINYLCVG